MQSTSIHITPCKIESSEQHNKRTKSLDYVRSELTQFNESWQSENKTLYQHLEHLHSIVKEKTGRKMQAKATPLREGVIVINENTTMDDLLFFAKKCEEKWGIKALQIHIHRDEGHMRAKDWKPNLHAHIVFSWIDETIGKSIKMKSHDMVEMQTLLAETLGMERGKKSDKKHLNAIQYKIEQQEYVLNKIDDIQKARNTALKPLDDIIKGNTRKNLFGVLKIDYEAIIEQYKEQEKLRAASSVISETYVMQFENEKLKKALQKEQAEVLKLKNELALMDEDIVRVIYNNKMLKEEAGLERLAQDVEIYNNSPTYDKIRERNGRIMPSMIFSLWFKKMQFKLKDIIISASKFGELLFNGKSFRDFLTKKVDISNINKQQEPSIKKGFKR